MMKHLKLIIAAALTCTIGCATKPVMRAVPEPKPVATAPVTTRSADRASLSLEQITPTPRLRSPS
ncbi:MAG TPA: hypothetical protein VF669_04160, partial [Tepidisphaeraceae bacterium]